MSHVSVMQVQKIGRVVVGFEDRQIFLAEVRVPRLATVKGEKEGIVGVICVKEVEITQVEDMVSGNCGKECI
jgi:hypothetical protein